MKKNSVLIFGIIIVGFIFNDGYKYSYLIKYLLMGMLFFPFLSVTYPKDRAVYMNVLNIFLAMTVISIFFYTLLIYANPRLATVAFLVAFTPTATAAPVVISFLKRNVDYVISSVVITNSLVAVSLPFALSLVNPGQSTVSAFTVLVSTLTVVLVPLASAQLLKKCCGELAIRLISFDRIPFFIWLVVLYLATSRASFYLINSDVALVVVFEIAAVSFCICFLNFMIGKYIGGEKYSKEASQSLGQKNTMFMVWVALEYIGPLAVMGPIFYLIYQNIYNSYLLSRMQ